jgi:hypothetical protein
MKHCPACNFTFPNFHRVCDFDGTELVPDPERPSPIKPRSSRLQRILKSPLFSLTLVTIGLFGIALVIGRYESDNQYKAMVQVQPSWNLPRRLKPASKPTASVAAELNLPARARTSRTVRSLSPRLRRNPSMALINPKSNSRFQRPAVARTDREASEVARTDRRASEVARIDRRTSEKEPKLTAVLKSTWRVIKRPFQF